MQSASSRGISSLLKTCASSRTVSLASRPISSQQSLNASVTARATWISRLHCSSVYKAGAAATATVEAPVQQSEEFGGPITRFEDLGTRGLVRQNVVDTLIQNMKLETMTPVQTQTVNEAVQGADTLAIARTGTGKTVAFLLPVIERILQNNPELNRPSEKGRIDIRSLIISPTRELAEQIAKEARRMVGRTGIKVGLAVGGTGRSTNLRSMHMYGCHILVGTPGRLNDLLSDRQTKIKAPRLSSFVLDEADRLLDDGFGPAIQEIYTHLPSKLEVDRQTLMFSATMGEEVMGMVRKFMKKDFRVVRTIPKGEMQTHQKVPQYAVVANGLENQLPALLELVKRESTADENFKAIVFHSTSALATLSYQVWEKSSLARMTGIPGSVIHSRLTQAARTRTSDKFRRAKTAVLFSSDVTARGMDFPNVTHVIQFGLPKDRDTYIHRLGRTARAGKEGQGWLLLTPWERQGYRQNLRDLPIQEDKSLVTAAIDMSQASSIPQAAANILTDAISAAKSTDFTVKSDAFRSVLSVGSSMDKQSLIRSLNRWSLYGWGLDPPPAVGHALAQKLGYLKVKDMNIGFESRQPAAQSNPDGGSGFSSRSLARPSKIGGRTPNEAGGRQGFIPREDRGRRGARGSFSRAGMTPPHSTRREAQAYDV